MASDDLRNRSRARRLVYFVTASGCGNHLIVDLLKSSGLHRVDDELEWFCRAFVTARRDPDAPVLDKFHEGWRALDVVTDYYSRRGVTWSGDPLDDAWGAAWVDRYIETGAGHNYYFVHAQGLTHSITRTLPDGTAWEWTIADRDEALAVLDRLLELAGFTMRRLALIRHPVNLYLSRRERYPEVETDASRRRLIDEFFSLVTRFRREENIQVLRYEDVCCDGPAALYRAVGLTDEEIAALGGSIVHRGEVAKWFNHPRALYRELCAVFSRHMDEFGYHALNVGPVSWPIRRLINQFPKLRAEIGTINAIFRGDFSRGEAMVRHRLSLGGRIFFRLFYLLPAHRRNYTAWCESRGEENLIRPLWQRLFRAG